MDRQAKKIVVVGSFLLCTLVGLQLGTSNHKPIMAAEAAVSSIQDDSQKTVTQESKAKSKNAFADVEERREQALEDKRNADELAKKQNIKAKSVECVFWKQQKKVSSAPSVDEKIAKFCNI